MLSFRSDALTDSDLAVQLDVFNEQRESDEAQITGPDGVDLSSHVDIFYAILRQVSKKHKNMFIFGY